MITKKDDKLSNNDDFAELLKYDDIKIPQIGDTVTGVVLSASKSEVRLDINGVITGVVRGRELYYEAEEYANLKPGDEIEATIFEEENENGELELSFRHAGEQKAWDNLINAYENKKIIKVKVSNANKGGLLASYGQIAGFLPVSQLSPDNYPRISGGDKSKILTKLKSFVNNELEVKIIALDQKEERLVVSEKEAWQENKKDIINKYKVGSVVEGKITAITNFGVFINFAENLEGLIHISELAWQRIDNPASLFKRGDILNAEIISIDGPKIFLSAKKLMKDPWQNVGKKYKEGQAVVCEILKVNPFGLFVKLDKDIHGLAHISQLNLAPEQKINQVFKVGDKQKFIIASIESEGHRLGLAIDKHRPEAAEKAKAKVQSDKAHKAASKGKEVIKDKQKNKKDEDKKSDDEKKEVKIEKKVEKKDDKKEKEDKKKEVSGEGKKDNKKNKE